MMTSCFLTESVELLWTVLSAIIKSEHFNWASTFGSQPKLCTFERLHTLLDFCLKKYTEKGVIVVETPSGTKFISNILFVPEISQNLLSVGQMLENHYALHFEDKSFIIYDPLGNELMTVKMK